MGPPLGPSLANIFMCTLERKFLDNCPSEFKPSLYRRCVDDAFCIFRNRQRVDKLMSYITSFHEHITFSYVDTLVTFNNNSFTTDLFVKRYLQVFITILAALQRILTKLIVFVRLFFEHTISVPRILVFIMNFFVLKDFLKKVHSLCLLLIV